ncbi:AbrB/MazE/SpoVT family DNA-binding domain-containing protein [Umezawaea sp. NPDC059074]|uniref:AbrB/MazE/SpoVT family DNA-binding domain-containing protein n=1 Tax=Umezawaea sp. NPDC059074 TaxID=3346716 RepID=UPI0036B182A9
MRISSRGRVTIPIDVRRSLDLHPGDEVALVVDRKAGCIRIAKSVGGLGRGRLIAESLLGEGDVDLATDGNHRCEAPDA